MAKSNHIPVFLPIELRFLNLIETYREGLRAYLEETGIRLHKDSHHLNSSQVACPNLFWPLYNFAEPESNVEAHGFGPDEFLSWEYEKVLDWRERTNFDLFLEHKSGAKTSLEFIYTEESFGSAPENERQYRKSGDIYVPA